MAVYGYVRVSTKGQVPGTSLAEQQQQILERYPNATMVQEAASGAHERQRFDSLCASLKPGDTLGVCKMDRFCRSARQGLEYVDALRQKGVAIHILNSNAAKRYRPHNTNQESLALAGKSRRGGIAVAAVHRHCDCGHFHGKVGCKPMRESVPYLTA